MSFDFSTLITDRSAADVQLWQQLQSLGWAGMSSAQQAQWSAGLKGAYNASDLNRVSDCMDYLAQLLQSLGYEVPGYASIGITWTNTSVPTASQMSQYLSNVQALMDVLTTATYSAALPTAMAGLTYVSANAIEQILFEINAYLLALQAVYLRSGAVWVTAGSPGFYFAN